MSAVTLRVLLPSLTCILLLACTSTRNHHRYVVGETSGAFAEYCFIDFNDDTLRKLKPDRYNFSFSDTIERFGVFGVKGMPGWYGVDLNETILFEVWNTSAGEISPDHLIENKIRITDSTGLIGFVNAKGNIIIKLQFEIATRFKGGFAVIGQDCVKDYWEPDEGSEHGHDSDCQHYSILKQWATAPNPPL